MPFDLGELFLLVFSLTCSWIVLHRTIIVSSGQLSIKTSVDPEEINRFRQLSSFWWNETGEYAPLHSLNQLRIPLIREQLLQSSSKINDCQKPLKNFQILDIGCGGGILTEVCILIKLKKQKFKEICFVYSVIALITSGCFSIGHRCRFRKYCHSPISC